VLAIGGGTRRVVNKIVADGAHFGEKRNFRSTSTLNADIKSKQMPKRYINIFLFLYKHHMTDPSSILTKLLFLVISGRSKPNIRILNLAYKKIGIHGGLKEGC
jgi:hypothetical protein